MDTKAFLRITLAAVTASASLAQPKPDPAQETLANRILRMSDADQIAFVDSDLSQGMPVDRSGPLGSLVLGRSSLVLPMMERKIEEVLKSPSPLDCFTDKTVDPQRFIDLAAGTIAYAGDEYALTAASKLIALDEKRFDLLVRNTLAAAQNRRNPFTVAYRGFEVGDPAVDKRIVAWAGTQFAQSLGIEFAQGQLKHWWAEAMAEKYGRVPNESDWADDPIASRIKPELAASLHDEILQLAAEAFEKRVKK